MGMDIFNKNLTQELPRGVIIETFGSGNVPANAYFINYLEELTRNKVPVLNISQCPGGEVIQGKYQASMKLKELGIISGKDLTFEAALTKMMYVLGNYNDFQEQCLMLSTALRGEMIAS